MPSRKSLLISILTVWLGTQAGLTEISPLVYEQLKRESPELLELRVTSVAVKEISQVECYNFHKREPTKKQATSTVRATARVLQVIRSASGVKEGGVITIAYKTHDSACQDPGATPPRILEKDQTLFAFLKKEGKFYKPAAIGRSFAQTPDVAPPPPPRARKDPKPKTKN